MSQRDNVLSMHAERVILLPWRLNKQGQPDHNATAPCSSSSGGEQGADRPEHLLQDNGWVLVDVAVRGGAVHQGGVLPIGGGAGPIGPRLGAPLQHAQ